MWGIFITVVFFASWLGFRKDLTLWKSHCYLGVKGVEFQNHWAPKHQLLSAVGFFCAIWTKYVYIEREREIYLDDASDEQMSPGMTIFHTNWRANEQPNGGYGALATLVALLFGIHTHTKGFHWSASLMFGSFIWSWSQEMGPGPTTLGDVTLLCFFMNSRLVVDFWKKGSLHRTVFWRII